ncbi:MAG: hypothetical protein H6506_04425 [Calditrichaeota bacterium]|nr:hypothetical protein [Calditrichota bacterium]MCB9367107.1 hypothetical protein [Calditrichota bacterium]MCB9391879.1 hypothetical protein [Calditrichota bacterium]
MIDSPSPFAKPHPGLRLKEYQPFVPRPTAEQVARFPQDATDLLDRIWARHNELIPYGQYGLDWIRGRHFIIAGGTGPGLGGAIESAVRRFASVDGSVTVLARDLTRSVGFEMGKQMTERAEKMGFGNRYHMSNDGMALEGPAFDALLHNLKEAGAHEVIYINCVAAAVAGMLPDTPPIYVKDVDDEGLFQYKLLPLSDQQIENTRHVMGRMAVEFPHKLAEAGIKVKVTTYIDWRGSLDVISRDPESPFYGRQGPYSTSLYLPKEFLQADTIKSYGHGRIVLDIFLPVMRTRALGFIPGAIPQSYIFEKMMKMSGIRMRDVPELALGTLDQIGRAVSGGTYNPFPRLDEHEIPLEEWYWQIVQRLNDDSSSEFYWKNWIEM